MDVVVARAVTVVADAVVVDDGAERVAGLGSASPRTITAASTPATASAHTRSSAVAFILRRQPGRLAHDHA
jgi:hypothetical protein